VVVDLEPSVQLIDSPHLYQIQAWKMLQKSLASKLATAKKCVTTADWQVAREELRFMRVLERIDELKSQNLWSFKQLKPQTAPSRRKTQWDLMLDEAVFPP
jgi:chromatin modification-related protein VID21